MAENVGALRPTLNENGPTTSATNHIDRESADALNICRTVKARGSIIVEYALIQPMSALHLVAGRCYHRFLPSENVNGVHTYAVHELFGMSFKQTQLTVKSKCLRRDYGGKTVPVSIAALDSIEWTVSDNIMLKSISAMRVDEATIYNTPANTVTDPDPFFVPVGACPAAGAI